MFLCSIFLSVPFGFVFFVPFVVLQIGVRSEFNPWLNRETWRPSNRTRPDSSRDLTQRTGESHPQIRRIFTDFKNGEPNLRETEKSVDLSPSLSPRPRRSRRFEKVIRCGLRNHERHENHEKGSAKCRNSFRLFRVFRGSPFGCGRRPRPVRGALSGLRKQFSWTTHRPFYRRPRGKDNMS
jgi:hypothetical protein